MRNLIHSSPKILIVEDHLLISKSYVNFLSTDFNPNNEIFEANSLTDAYELLFLNQTSDKIDLVLLDISMPPSEKYNIADGLALGKMIRDQLLYAKIIVITNYDSFAQIKVVEESIAPEGLMSKSDVDIDFCEICKKVIRGEIIRGEIIKKNSRVVYASDITLDSIDVKILNLISQGYDTKEKQEILRLSRSAIMQRKQKIRHFFGLETLSNAVLLQEAKKRNII
uniref:response regulator n=1 Tax=Flavobacterium sp. TaxID=239 RepID=UPI00404AA933